MSEGALTVERLLALVAGRGLKLVPAGEAGLKVAGPRRAITPKLLAAIRRRKPALLDRLTGKAPPPEPPKTPVARLESLRSLDLPPWAREALDDAIREAGEWRWGGEHRDAHLEDFARRIEARCRELATPLALPAAPKPVEKTPVTTEQPTLWREPGSE